MSTQQDPDKTSSGEHSQPYLTPNELGGGDKPERLITGKRVALALLVLVLVGGGAFATLASVSIIQFGGAGRNGPPQDFQNSQSFQNSVQQFGEGPRGGDPRDDPSYYPDPPSINAPTIDGSAQEE